MQKYTHINDIPILLYTIVFVIGVWGAILNFFSREGDKVNRSFIQKIGIFLLDLLTSTGISVVTFLALLGLGINELIAVGISGWIAHQGTRAIYLIELIVADKIGSQSMRDEVKKELK